MRCLIYVAAHAAAKQSVFAQSPLLRAYQHLYRDRWHIESFFKEIKQLLRIKSFMGTSANAVLIQVWT
ncbi:MAG: transposase, partial [Treponema sp.]|nr:transposase [Treponema sp.]